MISEANEFTLNDLPLLLARFFTAFPQILAKKCVVASDCGKHENFNFFG